jgi:hypothetical protein
MEPTKIRLLCPVCGKEIDRLSDLDYIKSEFPNRVLVCLNGKYAHYIIMGYGHFLAKYKNKVNFIYNLYLGLN